MTAITHVGTADTSTHPAFALATITEGAGSMDAMPPGIFCIGALTAPDGQLLYLSLIGRDTALQEFRGKLSTGKLTSFTIQWDGGCRVDGWFSREWLGQMEYHGAKLQTNLFGEMTQMVLYHPLMAKPDKASQVAAIPFLNVAEMPMQDVWNVVKHISEIPLLDGWQAVVIELLKRMGWLEWLDSFNCRGIYLKLGSNFGGLISANIRSGALCPEADRDGRYAFLERLTLDLEYSKQTPPPGIALPDPSSTDDNGWDAISTYTRQQAIADGVLVDVSDMAREAGFKAPVALTSSVWERFVAWDEGGVSARQQDLGQSTDGRLWDALWMAFMAIRKNREGGNSLRYSLHVIERDGYSATPRCVTLKLHSGVGDHGEHVITIMLPEED